MVPKESGFNQSETACGWCARIAWRFPCLPAPARDDKRIQTQHFWRQGDTIRHPNLSYVPTKPYGRYMTHLAFCNLQCTRFPMGYAYKSQENIEALQWVVTTYLTGLAKSQTKSGSGRFWACRFGLSVDMLTDRSTAMERRLYFTRHPYDTIVWTLRGHVCDFF